MEMDITYVKYVKYTVKNKQTTIPNSLYEILEYIQQQSFLQAAVPASCFEENNTNNYTTSYIAMEYFIANVVCKRNR